MGDRCTAASVTPSRSVRSMVLRGSTTDTAAAVVRPIALHVVQLWYERTGIGVGKALTATMGDPWSRRARQLVLPKDLTVEHAAELELEWQHPASGSCARSHSRGISP